jgi:hypothetical protein
MKNLIVSLLLLLASHGYAQQAGPDGSAAPSQANTPQSGSKALQYKVISGFKQPFDADLQSYISNGWSPVGGISVTSWNNDLYFAQLLSGPAVTNY